MSIKGERWMRGRQAKKEEVGGCRDVRFRKTWRYGVDEAVGNEGAIDALYGGLNRSFRCAADRSTADRLSQDVRRCTGCPRSSNRIVPPTVIMIVEWDRNEIRKSADIQTTISLDVQILSGTGLSLLGNN